MRSPEREADDLTAARAPRPEGGLRTEAPHPITPDGRYFVVRGRLWRCSDPGLRPAVREALVRDLMSARRAIRKAVQAEDALAVTAARSTVDRAKRALGERGPVWWTDGAPDLNRKMARNTAYADWFETLDAPTGATAQVQRPEAPLTKR